MNKEYIEDKKYKIIWLTGGSGSGKTTIAKELSQKTNSIILDGDEMRDSISLGAGFSREDRTEHNYRVARLAKILSKQSNVIVSVICPIEEVRDKISEMLNPIWIYIERDLPERENHFYETPLDYFKVNNDNYSAKYNTEIIYKKIKEELK